MYNYNKKMATLPTLNMTNGAPVVPSITYNKAEGNPFTSDGSDGDGRVSDGLIVEGNPVDGLNPSTYRLIPTIVDQNNNPIANFTMTFNSIGTIGNYSIWDTTGTTFVEWASFFANSSATITFSDLDTTSPTASFINAGWNSDVPTSKLPTNFLIIFEGNSNFDFVIYAVSNNCCPSFTLVPKVSEDNTIIETKICNIKVGDMVRTLHGNLKVSAVMRHPTPFKYSYVKFPKECFGENLPSNDLYLTTPHPFSLGYVNHKDLFGYKDDTIDENVFIHISANELLGKLPEIVKEEIIDEANYNLIFDVHTSINIYNLDFCTHHPGQYKGTMQRYLNDDEYHDKNVPKKLNKAFYISYDNLLEFKPENMELKTFLGKCLTSNQEDKFKFNDLSKLNNILHDTNLIRYGKK